MDRKETEQKNSDANAIVYNVTIQIEAGIEDHWLKWMKNEHIPEVLDTKCFYDYRILKLLENDHSDGATYAIQYFAYLKADYDRYIENHAPELRKKTIDKWGERFIAFRTVMQVVK